MTTQASNGTDQLLAEILGELAEKFKSGDPVDPDAYLASYPEHAADLRRLLPAMQAMAELGVSASASSSPLAANADAAPLADVLGDYRIIRQIGQGGMGVVYEAEQLSMRRRVAIKVLPFAAVMDQRQLARFKNEAMAAGLLTHQNIVPVYSVGCEKGVHYYAMQYVEGHTLAEVIGQLRRFAGLERTNENQPDDGFEVASQVVSGRFASSDKVSHLEPTIESGTAAPESDRSGSLAYTLQAGSETKAMAALSTEKSTKSPDFFRTIAQLGIQGAEALDHAHKQGVLHRDVKPANLILDGTGNLWMTDFGLARLEANPGMTVTGDLIGTLRYMSPEQAMAKRVIVDHRTDIYSLGVTLYELLTLHPAYPGRDREELLKQIAFTEPKAPRRVNPAIPGELETITLKAMAKDPEDRYATAQDLADDLRRHLEDKPIHARRPGPWLRTKKWSRRNKGFVASAIAVALLVLGVGVARKLEHNQAVRAATISVRESLAAVEASIQAGDLVRAREHLAQAEGRLAGSTASTRSLATQVNEIQTEVDSRMQAADRFKRFMQLTDEATYRLSNPGAGGVETAQQALNLFGVLRNPHWIEALQRSRLSAERIAQVRQTSYEMLVLLADHVVRWWSDARTNGPTSREDAGRDGLAYLRRALEIRSPTKAAYHVRSKCWWAIGDASAKEADAERAEGAKGSIALDHFLLGRDAAWSGDKPAAIRQFQSALNLQADHYWSLFLMGLYLMDLNRHEEALIAFDACLALRPQHGTAYNNRSIVLLRLGRFDEAVADGRRAVDLSLRYPPDALARCYLNLGAALRRAGDLPESEQAVRKSIALREKAVSDSPKVPEYRAGLALAYSNLANLLFDTQRRDEAVSTYRTALSTYENLGSAFPERSIRRDWQEDRARVHHNFGRILGSFGKFDEAQQTLRAAVDLGEKLAADNPQMPRFQIALAHSYFHLAKATGKTDPEQAAQTYHRAADVLKGIWIQFPDSPISGEILNNLAWVFATSPVSTLRDPRAVELAERAVDVAPDAAGFRNTLGVAYYRAGRWRDAVAALEKAEKSSPGQSLAFNGFFLAMAHSQLARQADLPAQDRARHQSEAEQWYAKSVQWTNDHAPNNEELGRFRDEAKTLMASATEPFDRQ